MIIQTFWDSHEDILVSDRPTVLQLFSMSARLANPKSTSLCGKCQSEAVYVFVLLFKTQTYCATRITKAVTASNWK